MSKTGLHFLLTSGLAYWYPVEGYWVCQHGFDERGARVLTHGRACSVRDINNTSAIEMSVYFADTGSNSNSNSSSGNVWGILVWSG